MLGEAHTDTAAVVQGNLAPLAVFSSAFSSGQSETASEPSFIASVSRFGLETEPESVVAADDDRSGQFAAAHHLVERRAQLGALAEANPADARRQAPKLMRSRAMSSQRCRCSSSGISSFTMASVL